jgi:hypothetical protein
MTRILLILLTLTLSYFNCSAQTKDLKFDRMRISHNGDSIIKQEYELIVKSKRVYFITPFASYLHIKGGKYRTRVRLDKTKREKILNLVSQLIWTNFQQVDDKGIKNKYFVVEIFSSGNLISNFKVSDELLPPDFKELFDTLTGE